MTETTSGTDADIYDPAFVADVFDRCSDQYIWFSTVSSFGFTQLWRRQCVGLLAEPETEGRTCLDLMSGTGEIWPHLRRGATRVEIINAVDISSAMHERAKARISALEAQNIDFTCANLLAAELAPASADMIVSTFGLKTFNAEQHAVLAELIATTLKPGGTFSLIEASDPDSWVLAPLYRFYLKRFLPIIERLVLRGATDFRMLGVYTDRFRNASDFGDMLRANGLDVRYTQHFFGCATSVSGRKPI